MTDQIKPIVAARGLDLRCKGWRQEAILRMLENNIENAERPEDLLIYMSRAKAARDWQAYDRICKALKVMETDQTLVMQSGKPVGLFPTQDCTPIVIMANGNLVGRWTEVGKRRVLENKGLTIFPGMTAAAWQYIGSQGILQGTYETFKTVGRDHFGGDLSGRWIITSGCGGMGGAQALAGKLAGAVTLVIDVSRQALERRLNSGYLDLILDDLDTALQVCAQKRAEGSGAAIGLCANAATILTTLIERDITPDVITDQTEPDAYRGYVPEGMSVQECQRAREEAPEALAEAANRTMLKHFRAMLTLRDRGAICFEYGNNFRSVVSQLGEDRAFEIDSFVKAYIRPLFCQGIGPFRWIAASGDPKDIDLIDDLILENFDPESPIAQWIAVARENVQHTGLPARIGWLGFGERAKLATLVNEAVADGRISGPVCFTRDHLDSGSAALPFRETDGMQDGSDAVADWPLLNALLNASAGADLVAIHEMDDWARCAGVTLIADGSESAAKRIRNVLDCDPGIGIARHADAGYDRALEALMSPAYTRRITPASTLD
ncbi:urocanate hydratase [Paracoccus seriniphilus]|uniref:Urocanate hydratase n=1 Tax=Paracoccus seriniphilus TaxID=184748 RepID=A0A239PTV8_9RHOB|nr:urocanate hydratase [Paracoccus seriniphilus]WCR16530.1 urocanate hydratase [Paracoccus seriniphilus]SNT73741.1 urocanate hydratase [Paracoccus seriniphilus]